jgi:hypothetical protein
MRIMRGARLCKASAFKLRCSRDVDDVGLRIKTRDSAPGDSNGRTIAAGSFSRIHSETEVCWKHI